MPDTSNVAITKLRSTNCVRRSPKLQTMAVPCSVLASSWQQVWFSVSRGPYTLQNPTTPEILAHHRQPPRSYYRFMAGESMSMRAKCVRGEANANIPSYFLFLALMFLFLVDAIIFENCRVNYPFIFELDTRSNTNWRQISEVPSVFACMLGVSMWFNFAQIGGPAMYIYWPVMLIGVSPLLPSPT